MDRKKIWLLLAHASNPDVALIAPTAAWIAEQAGADFECYFEDYRDGRLLHSPARPFWAADSSSISTI